MEHSLISSPRRVSELTLYSELSVKTASQFRLEKATREMMKDASCICLYTAIISWANNRRVFGDGRRISKDSAGSRNYDDQFLASGMSNRIAFVYLFVEHEGNGFCQSALSQCNSSACVRRGCKGKSIVAKNYGKCVIAVVRGRIAGTRIIPWLECWSKIICVRVLAARQSWRQVACLCQSRNSRRNRDPCV